MKMKNNDYKNVSTGDLLSAKVNVDVPDRVYINLFFTIFFAATAAGAAVAIVKRIITKD